MNLDLIINELQRMRINKGAKQFIFDVVLPTMQEVGRLVAKGKYTVTQEHIISLLIRDQVSQISLPRSGNKTHEMILATPEKNLHELSILFADIICKSNNISTRYLGAAHPANCLALAVNALKSPYLILGVVSSDHWNYEQNIVEYLKTIDQLLEYKITVILGGGFELDLPKFKKIEKVIFMETFEDFDIYLMAMKI